MPDLIKPSRSNPIVTIDMVPILKRAAIAVNPQLHMEVFKARIMKRIEAGEHIHLQGDPIEECLYPEKLCWEGPREINRTR